MACIKSLRAEGIEPTGYWYNPNIHPFTEYRVRRNTVTEYAQSIGLALETNDFYGLRPFCAAVAENINGRCAVCYACRMRETARYAVLHGFTHFSTTLLYSPYQKHDLLRAAAEEAAEEFGVEFLYRDFRPLFRQGQEEARALNLYLQKYCGCVFSEEERYSKRYQKLAAHARRAEDGETPGGAEQTKASEAAGASVAVETLQASKAAMLSAGLRFEAAAQAEARAYAAAMAQPVQPGPDVE